jgi:hypothetical protein
MAATAPANIAPAQAGVACAAGDGCSYLRELSAIEHIAGFEHTACRYAAAAAVCRDRGCRAMGLKLPTQRTGQFRPCW